MKKMFATLICVCQIQAAQLGLCTQSSLRAAGGPSWSMFLNDSTTNFSQVQAITGTLGKPTLGFYEQLAGFKTQIGACNLTTIRQYGGCLQSTQAMENQIDSLADRGAQGITINGGVLPWTCYEPGCANVRQQFADLFDPQTGYMPTHYPGVKLIYKWTMATENTAPSCAVMTAGATASPFLSPVDLQQCLLTTTFNQQHGACGGQDCGSWLQWQGQQYSVLGYILARYGSVTSMHIWPSEPHTINGNLSKRCSSGPTPQACDWGSDPDDNNAPAWRSFMAAGYSLMKTLAPAVLADVALDRTHYYPFDWTAALNGTPGLQVVSIDVYETNPQGSIQNQTMADDIAIIQEARQDGYQVAATEFGLTTWEPYNLQPGGDGYGCFGDYEQTLWDSGYMAQNYQAAYDYWNSQGLVLISCYQCMNQAGLLVQEPPFSGNGHTPLDSESNPSYQCKAYAAAVSGTANISASGICTVTGVTGHYQKSPAWGLLQSIYQTAGAR